MQWVRLFLRVFGWLLTPFMAWAASFFGCVAGAVLATQIRDPITGLIVTAAFGGIAGFSGLMLWLRLLRRSPEIREALAVGADGTPEAAAPPPVAEAAAPAETGQPEPVHH